MHRKGLSVADDNPLSPVTLDGFVEWFVTAVVGTRMAAWANTNDSHSADDRLYVEAMELATELVYHERDLPPLPPLEGDSTRGLATLRLWATRASQLRSAGTVTEAQAGATPAPVDRPVKKARGWTAAELCSEAEISEDTFRRILKAAGIPLASPGGGGAQRRFGPLDVVALIETVTSSTLPRFRKQRKIAEAWRSLVDPQ